MKKPFIFLFVWILTTMVSANNISLTNIKVTGQNIGDQYTMVQCDIAWENSWRTGSAPGNWDAAWVFVKFRISGGEWKHATLNVSGHTAPAGSAITAAPDGTGVFIYRNTDGAGAFSANSVQLRWNYGINGVADNAVVDVRVFAIEMVYVPGGSFSLGSGGAESGHFYKYPADTDPYLVGSESAITIGQSAGNLWGSSTTGTNTIGPAGTLDAAFPKGYAAFYCMKYEMSQQEYVDFLNMLTYAQQATRTPVAPNLPAGTYLSNAYRNKIKISQSGIAATVPAVYATDNPYVACNDISWPDVAAFLDWSGLRPLSELEFEKACRGTIAPVPDEFAWGTTGIAGSAYSLMNGGASNEMIGTNYSTGNGNAAYNLTTPLNGSVNGPVRTGVFAGTAGNSGRVTAGATYYGIMEMSGNLRERPVTVGNTTGRSFTGNHGDGILSTAGDANVLAWPGTDAIGSGLRGGTWSNDVTRLRVSDRTLASNTSATRSITYGGRGIRTAP